MANPSQTEIRQISRESAPDVETWIANAKALQADIEKSRKLSSEIVRQAEALETHPIEEHEAHVEFLQKEVRFNAQLGEALQSIKEVDTQLKLVEKLVCDVLQSFGFHTLCFMAH
jgi:centromere/kinetochore protein ZW10